MSFSVSLNLSNLCAAWKFTINFNKAMPNQLEHFRDKFVKRIFNGKTALVSVPFCYLAETNRFKKKTQTVIFIRSKNVTLYLENGNILTKSDGILHKKRVDIRLSRALHDKTAACRLWPPPALVLL